MTTEKDFKINFKKFKIKSIISHTKCFFFQKKKTREEKKKKRKN